MRHEQGRRHSLAGNVADGEEQPPGIILGAQYFAVIAAHRAGRFVVIPGPPVPGAELLPRQQAGLDPRRQVQVLLERGPLARAAALDFVDDLPDGYRTVIGEDGVNLSDGEAQRIALARAFLLSPKVVILDEPTSSIDTDTEARIAASLRRLREKSTIIIIAHRPSTIRIADTVAVVKDHRVRVLGEGCNLVEAAQNAGEEGSCGILTA